MRVAVQHKRNYATIYVPVILVLWLGLFLDSSFVAERQQYGQWLTNSLVLACFIWVYKQVAHRVKKLMLYGVGLAYLGEVIFAILFGMYEYRLENVPIYVPFGHSLVYAAVFYIHKEHMVQWNKTRISSVLYWAMILYSSLWLILDHDLFGFLCTLCILALLKKTKTPLFFLIMYFMVVYLELLGTYYQCWLWPGTWFAKVSFIPSSNPPSGISVFYFAFDIGCLWLYKTLNPKKWKRKSFLHHSK